MALLACASWSASACEETYRYSVYPSHRILEGTCKTHAEAMAACKATVQALGHPEHCTYTPSAGWLNIGGGNWYFVKYSADPQNARPEKNMGAPDCPGQCFGDPINAGNANKFESKVEYRGDGPFPLEFSWTYNYLLLWDTLPPNAYVLGGNRTFNYGSRATRWALPTGAARVFISRPDGKVAAFKKPASGNEWVPYASVTTRLLETPTGWEYEDEDGHIEVFDSAGLLTQIRSPDGYRQLLTYDSAGRLQTVTDPLGRQLGFQYNAANLISQLDLPDGRTIKLAYTPEKRLTVVEYQDGTKVKYLYDEVGYIGSSMYVTGALTGVEDESGARYSSTRYSADRAKGTELAGSLDQYTSSYTSSDNGTFMTYAQIGLPSGASRKLNLASVNGRIVPTKIVTECSGCTPRTVSYTYDLNGHYDVINDNGVVTDYDYDARGRLLKQVEAASDISGLRRTTQTDWHADFRVPTARRVYDASNALAINETWTYNARGQALTHSQLDVSGTAPARTITTTYCEQADVDAGRCPVIGLPTLVDGPRTDVADTLSYSYYASDDSGCATGPSSCDHRKGDVWKATNALGHVVLEALRYNGAGQLLSSKNSNDVVTDYEYHARGWPTAVKVRGSDDSVETDDRITRIEYRPTGLVERITLPDGDYLRYAYDDAHRLTDVFDQAGNTVHYTLDATGNRKQEDVKTVSGTLKRTMSRVYNLYNELSAIKDASQNATGFTYDALGNPDRTTDALGRITDQDYDPLGRLVRTLQDVGGLEVQTDVRYNARDQIIQVTDPNRLATHYRYNGFGDHIQLESPDTGITDYTYDAAGQLATKKDANDAAANRYTYDALGRPKAIFYTATGPADVEYDYDTVNTECTAGQTFALGRLTASRTEGNELKYCYDRFGRIVRKVQIVAGRSFTLQYAYTLGGSLSAITYPDGVVVDYVRDAQSRIKEIGVRPSGGIRTTLLSNATYEPFGPVSGWTYGNGRTLNRTYDQDYRPKTILDSASGGLSLGYGYNSAGELTELKDGLQSTLQAKYEYDTLGRLTVTRDSASNALDTYGYDKTGNRKSLLHGGITDAYVYPVTSHRLTSVSGVPRGYDAAGNTVSIGSTAKEFVYNANDRLSQFKQGGAIKASYSYNAAGERVATTGATTAAIDTYTLYDEDGSWIGDYNSAGAAKQQAVWFDSVPVGLVIGSGSTQSLQYVQPDHLGTPRAVIDPARNVAIWTWDAKSEAFGNSPPNQDPDLDGTAFMFNMRFPGQRFDPASGLVYNYFRDYDPGTGRYVQSDPIGLIGGTSTYIYVGAAPLAYVDPLGLQAGCQPTGLAWCQQKCAAAGLTMKACVTTPALLGLVREEQCDCDDSCPIDKYENPGTHDPSNRGRNPYNSTKSKLPTDHEDLWRQSRAGPDGNRWTKVGNGKNAEYHRFQNDGNGNWHWNGSTSGKTANGAPRAIRINDVPSSVQRW
ncbi:RHS repeat-associated core domain-containing protein [Lysobacter enzymogenes]|uniref:RHS repeat-associated core domain-containing protein n=1 Tax=Lysobacter enzymogenes TaxID=69 RepID=UPI001AF66FDC|nr:RHS repeat-associated core domain-containing protein [Lysobacter enzymogenes]QQQ01283.1 RHS repeat protein [Lysobacter enzymogenes]